MILVADSGSTKTNWVLSEGKNRIFFTSPGFHPLGIDEESAAQMLLIVWPEQYAYNDVKHVYFFGSGCFHTDGANKVRHILSGIFSEAKLIVRSDLEGAAISTLGGESGIAAILGTGSSAALWDGRQISRISPSLGYLLGDEGSGADLGKALIRDFLYGNCPEKIAVLFRENNAFTQAEILHNLKSSPNPGALLGEYASILTKAKDDPYTINLVRERFLLFVKSHLLPLSADRDLMIGFNGSIAYEFQEIMQSITEDEAYSSLIFQRAPIESLVSFYEKRQGI